MKSLKMAICGVCACLIAGAQVPEVRPQVAGRAVQEGQITVVYLAPRFATAIRMPDAVNSVVLGDPDSFTAEHSEREPQIVFVKPTTAKAAQTNLLISTAHGYQANLLLISRGEAAGTQPDVDRADRSIANVWPGGGNAVRRSAGCAECRRSTGLRCLTGTTAAGSATNSLRREAGDRPSG